MEVEHSHEIGRENDEEMEIENRDVDPGGMLVKKCFFFFLWIKCLFNSLCFQ